MLPANQRVTFPASLAGLRQVPLRVLRELLATSVGAKQVLFPLVRMPMGGIRGDQHPANGILFTVARRQRGSDVMGVLLHHFLEFRSLDYRLPMRA